MNPRVIRPRQPRPEPSALDAEPEAETGTERLARAAAEGLAAGLSEPVPEHVQAEMRRISDEVTASLKVLRHAQAGDSPSLPPDGYWIES